MTTEYRVAWKREGCRPKYRIYHRQGSAKRFLLLFSEEPWRYASENPEALVCCSGYECWCGGVTLREAAAYKRKNMPPLEYLRLEAREVGEWTTRADALSKGGKA